ncbi:hypothetical protein D3C80_753810 [compost metagenome]
MLGFVIEEALLLGGQRWRGRGQQPPPVGPAREQFGVPPNIAGFDRRLLGRTHSRHNLAEARHGRARQNGAAQGPECQQQQDRCDHNRHDGGRDRRDHSPTPARHDPDRDNQGPRRHTRLHEGQDESREGQCANPDQHGFFLTADTVPPDGLSRLQASSNRAGCAQRTRVQVWVRHSIRAMQPRTASRSGSIRVNVPVAAPWPLSGS